MNYHLMVDDKFIDLFIEKVCDLDFSQNRFLVPSTKEAAKYVRSEKAEFVGSRVSASALISSNIKEGDRLFLHWMDWPAMQLVNSLSKGVEVGLFFWGGELLENPKRLFMETNYDPLTLRMFRRINLKEMDMGQALASPFGILRYLRSHFRRRLNDLRFESEKRKALSRLDYFLHWNQKDFELLKDRYAMPKTRFEYHFYGQGKNLSDFIEDLNDSNHCNVGGKGLRILLGNSATYSNNHLDALENIRRFRDEEIEIIVPFSYGEERDGIFQSKVRQRGEFLFPSRINFSYEFMGINEYIAHLARIDIALMCHNRTQAAGNIFLLLQLGKKVFLKSNNTIYGLLKDSGCVVFSLDDFNQMSLEDLRAPLLEADIEKNIRLIEEVILNENRSRRTIEELLS